MYVPAHFAADDEQVRGLLSHIRAADLVTSTPRGMLATYLPLLYDPDAGEHGALLGHVARNNDQWREPATGESLVIVHGPDAYVTPSWYASKAEHGRVVPTWNYVTPRGSTRTSAGSPTCTRPARPRRGPWATRPRSSSTACCVRSSASSW
jgi:transcriptional regulator